MKRAGSSPSVLASARRAVRTKQRRELAGPRPEEVDRVVLPVRLVEPDPGSAGRTAIGVRLARQSSATASGGSGMPTVPSGLTAMPTCGGRPRANSRAGATVKDMWLPTPCRNCASELNTGTYGAPPSSTVGRSRLGLAGPPPSGSGTHTLLRPSTSSSRAPALGTSREAARVSSSSLPGHPFDGWGVAWAGMSAASVTSARHAVRQNLDRVHSGRRAAGGSGARPAAASRFRPDGRRHVNVRRRTETSQGPRRLPHGATPAGAAARERDAGPTRPGGLTVEQHHRRATPRQPPALGVRSSRPTARRCRTNAYPETPRPRSACPAAPPRGRRRAARGAGCGPGAGPRVRASGAPRSACRSRARRRTLPKRRVRAGRRSARGAPADGRRRTGASGAEPRPTGPGCPGSRSRTSWTVRRISVDLPLPGRPETTTRSPAAKCRLRGPPSFPAPQVTHHRRPPGRQLPGGYARLPGHPAVCGPRRRRVTLPPDRPPLPMQPPTCPRSVKKRQCGTSVPVRTCRRRPALRPPTSPLSSGACHDVRANCIPAVRIHAGEFPVTVSAGRRRSKSSLESLRPRTARMRQI